MIAFVFPGQGSQYIGMGKEFYENFSEVKTLFNKAEELTQIPVRKLCFEGPLCDLTITRNLQVCLTVVSIACYLVLRNKFKEKNIYPSFVAGHSLGEYSALFSAEVLSFEDTLKAVKERARLMDEAGKKSNSTMYAIIGFPLDKLKKIIKNSSGLVIISNYNSPKQLVISGEIPAVDKVAEEAKNQGAKKVMKLKVSAGFHSPLMKEAEEELKNVLNKLSWKPPKIPFVSNVSGKAETSVEEIKNLMKKQITSSVKWIDCVNFMYNKGVKIFIEIGPKKVLSGLISQILEDKEFKCYNVENLQTLNLVCQALVNSQK